MADLLQKIMILLHIVQTYLIQKDKMDFHSGMHECPQLTCHMGTKIFPFIVIAIISSNIQYNMNSTYTKIVKGVHFGFKCYACAHKICLTAALKFSLQCVGELQYFNLLFSLIIGWGHIN